MKDTPCDSRLASTGSPIPSITYSDQPYVVVADDGAWVCAMTTGSGHEGSGGQHIISQRSLDQGETWTDRTQIEPPTGPEASWVVLAKAQNGRIFAFYIYNRDNIREVRAVDPAFSQISKDDSYIGADDSAYVCRRVDSLGAYMCKYSDDHGRTWSDRRFEIPVREFDIDVENSSAGSVRYFWNVGRPFVSGSTLFLPIHKVGDFGYGFFVRSEGALIQSDDILSIKDPSEATWETLPEGRVGIRAPEGAGPIAEEHSFLELSDGSFFVVFRTISGYPACSYSRDRGKSWSDPGILTRADGRAFKNPRAANFAWSCGDGRYLYWFHNHGGRRIQEKHAVDASYPYQAPRNPCWLAGGVESDGPDGKVIRWSEPVIAVYDDDPFIRMSYPDLVQDGGEDGDTFFLTYTNKHTARVHRLGGDLPEGLWRDAAGERPKVPLPAASVGAEIRDSSTTVSVLEMPELPSFQIRDSSKEDFGGLDLRSGITIEIAFKPDDLVPGAILFDSRDSWGVGIVLRVSLEKTIEFIGYDAQTKIIWDTDPGVVVAGCEQHLTVIIDGGPKIIHFVVNGRQCDGGDSRQLGWARFSPNLQHLTGAPTARLGSDTGTGTGTDGARVTVSRAAIYARALTTSEAVGLYRLWAAG